MSARPLAPLPNTPSAALSTSLSATLWLVTSAWARWKATSRPSAGAAGGGGAEGSTAGADGAGAAGRSALSQAGTCWVSGAAWADGAGAGAAGGGGPFGSTVETCAPAGTAKTMAPATASSFMDTDLRMAKLPLTLRQEG